MENILKEYKGSIIFVSHDRYFVNKIADSVLAFEQDEVVYFNGTYEEYIEYREKKGLDITKEKIYDKEKKNTNNGYFQDKENEKRKNKIKKLELEIEQKEDEIKSLKEEMQSEEICTDYIKLKELQEQIENIEKAIEEKMLEWEELNKLCEEYINRK